MATTINNIPGISGVNPLMKQDTGAGSPDGSSFGDILKSAVGGAIDAQHKSEQVTAGSLMGKSSMTDVLQATNDAEVALNTVLAIRDRVVTAWQDVMHSQI